MPIRNDLYKEDIPRVGEELRARKNLKDDLAIRSEATLKDKRRNIGLSIREDKLRMEHGLLPRYGRTLHGGGAQRSGGYHSIDEIPADAAGVPLKSVRQDPFTGTYLPGYEREAVPDEIKKERGYAEIANETKMAEAERRNKYPSNFQRVGDALTSRFTSFVGGPDYKGASASEPDYNSMSEEELWSLGHKGDARAIEAGKKRFGNI